MRLALLHVNRLSAGIAALALALAVAPGRAQQEPAVVETLPDGTQIFTFPVPSSTGTVVREPRGVKLRVVQTKGLQQPWDLAFLPDGSILITERAGRLRIVRKGVLDPEPITGIPKVSIGVQKGLMGLALHPRYAENKLVYFTYSKPMPNHEQAATATLARARYDGGHALTDVRDIFVTDAWAEGAQAAPMLFGPDGKIYMGVGLPTRHEIGKVESAQDPKDHAGKILRLNDDGTAPSDNPFVGKAGYKPEIYAMGIRNAVGMTFHPTTGELWATDNGPMGGDEINAIKPGHNYGWPSTTFGLDYSGNPTGGLSGPTTTEKQIAGMDPPFLIWVPSIAPAGILFPTSDKFPTWKGSMLVGALTGAQMQRIVLNQRGQPINRIPMFMELRQRIRTIRQGPDGLLYLLVASTQSPVSPGAMLRLEPVEASK